MNHYVTSDVAVIFFFKEKNYTQEYKIALFFSPPNLEDPTDTSCTAGSDHDSLEHARRKSVCIYIYIYY